MVAGGLTSAAAIGPRHQLGFALATAVFIGVITAIANSTGQAYVLFPELGALAWVIFTDPKGPWATSPRLLMLTPFLTALLGVAITRSMPYGPMALGLDVVGCLLIIRGLSSPIVPAISAGVLPLALGIHDWAYPVSILVGTGGLALLSQWRARRLAPAATATPPMAEVSPTALDRIESSFAMTPTVPLRRWAGALAVFLALGLVLVKIWDSPLVLFPPLLVIAYDMLALPHHSPWLGRGGAMMLVGTGAAWAGYGLVAAFGVVPWAAFLAVLITLGLLHLARLTCPPCLGLALLPFVITHPNGAYPWQALTGMACLVAVVSTTEAWFPRSGARELSS
ncbi:MAG: hypothetical protein NTW02_04085 [Cyanobium sp. LacPavin_0920_WC12_MAG_62_9]|nr:hypothetical protein [Cyanobium sp. LacPavin_0920_WC12_MAG_62_9]